MNETVVGQNESSTTWLNNAESNVDQQLENNGKCLDNDVDGGNKCNENSEKLQTSSSTNDCVLSTEATTNGSSTKLFCINLGPMSEGHVRLCDTIATQKNNQSSNLSLFTICLFIVGIVIASIGLTLIGQHRTMILGLLFVIFGSISSGSAILYILIYLFMLALRQTRKNQVELRQSSLSSGRDELCTNVTAAAAANSSIVINRNHSIANINGKISNSIDFDTLVNPNENNVEVVKNVENEDQQTIRMINDVINEGNGLFSSIPSSTDLELHLNVDHLDYDSLVTTQNLDSTNWRTINCDLPQKYLESFGELPNNLLPSPKLEHDKKTKRSKKKIHNGKPFSFKTQGKSNSQTELLDSENEGENTLFHVETIGINENATRLEDDNQLKDEQINGHHHHQCQSNEMVNEKITLISDNSPSNQIVVHFNRKNELE